MPLFAGSRTIGFCELSQPGTHAFSERHIQWIEALAGQSAVVIQNSWLFEQVRAGRERLQSLSRWLVEIQENERRYIARELHGEAGQMLTSLMIGLELLERDAHDSESVIAELNRLIKDNGVGFEPLSQTQVDQLPYG